jgi:hypothetical protein
LAIVSAIASLALSIPVSRLLHAKKVPLRTHWSYLATQVVAGIAIVIAAIAVVPQFSSPDRAPEVETPMTQTPGNQIPARAINRLRAHWPTAQIQFSVAPGAPDQLETIRVRVSDHVYLEAGHSGRQWSVHAFTDASGRLVPVEPDRPYTMGVDVGASPEELADRFYEEIYLWWAELHPGQESAPQQLPA